MAALTGCFAPKYDVEVYMSPKFLDVMKVYPAMEVDLIGVNPNEAERLRQVSIAEYFDCGNELRNNTEKYTVTFSGRNVLPKVISRRNPIWDTFMQKNANQLLLIVNIPCDGGKDNAKDPRKVMIPLERPGLFDSRKLYFELLPTGIVQLAEQPKSYPTPDVFDGKDVKK